MCALIKKPASNSLPTRLARDESRSSDTSFSGCPGGWLEPARVGFRMPPVISESYGEHETVLRDRHKNNCYNITVNKKGSTANVLI